MKAVALAIYDNGGKTVDRYTVVIGRDIFTMSTDPSHYMGVNGYWGTVDEVKKGAKWGKKKLLDEVPTAVRLAIQERMNI